MTERRSSLSWGWVWLFSLALVAGLFSGPVDAAWSVWKSDGGSGSSGWTVKEGAGSSSSSGSGSASGWSLFEGKPGGSNQPSPQPPPPSKPEAPPPGGGTPGGPGSPESPAPGGETPPGSGAAPGDADPPASGTRPETATVDRFAESSLFDLLNEARKEHGREPVAVSADLVALARKKARDMAVNQYFSHVSPTYGTVFDMLKREGIAYKWAGENIGRGASTYSIHRGFMESPEHRANLLSAGYTHVGIGVVRYRGKVYVAQLFMKPR